MDCIFYTQQSEDTRYTNAELFWTHVDHLSSISIAKADVERSCPGLPRQERSGSSESTQIYRS